MFHFFHWKVQKFWLETYLINPHFGIQAYYVGIQSEGDFFLYPYLDENKKSVFYFAFDTDKQKSAFEQLLKISGVWPKTAFQICQLPSEDLQSAIEQMDSKFFQSIPGIGPKLAKKIILELKGNFKLEEAESIDTKHKNFKAILKSLKNLGYDGEKVKETLTAYPGNLQTDDLASVIKRVIARM